MSQKLKSDYFLIESYLIFVDHLHYFLSVMEFWLLKPIQDGHFRGCSRMGGVQKGPLSLIFVTHMLQ